MIIAATSDVHSPIFYDEFVKALEELVIKPDIFIICGDMIEMRKIEEYEKISNALFGKITCPIIAVFGNTEFEEYREEIRKKHKNIIFLDDQSFYLNIKDKTVGIYGTTGSLDEPTKWQKANIPSISQIYNTRYEKAFQAIRNMKTDIKILVTHYSCTYKTLEGENPRIWSHLGSRVYENILMQLKPTLCLHGHAHKGTPRAWIDSVPVFNVNFPLNKKIVVIDTEKDLITGLKKFV